jgi:hypothetical protein
MVDDEHQISVLGTQRDQEKRIAIDQIGPKGVGGVASHDHRQDWDDEKSEMTASGVGVRRGFGFG